MNRPRRHLALLLTACLSLLAACQAADRADRPAAIDGDAAAELSPLATIEQIRALDYRLQWHMGLAVPAAVDIQHVAVMDNGDLAVVESDNFVTYIEGQTGEVRWRKVVGNRFQDLMAPVFHNEHVLVSTAAQVFVLSAINGRLVDVYDLEHSAVTPPAIERGHIIFGGADGKVFAHELGTGIFIWAYQMSGAVETRLLDLSGQIFLVDRAGHVAAFNAESGRIIYRKTDPPYDGVVAAPVAHEALVYVASLDQTLYAFNRTGGRLAWRYLTERPLRRTPVVLGNRLYQYTSDRGMVAMEAATSRELWRADWDGVPVNLRDSELIVVEGANTLAVADVETGEIYDRHTFAAVDRFIFPQSEGGPLYLIAGDGRIMKLGPR